VLIANSNLVGRWATWEHFRELDAKGLMMYGQMTAGSWIDIGSLGIVQGTYETYLSLASQHFKGSLKGTLNVTAGVERTNARQREVVLAKLVRALGGTLREKRIAVWGLAFKPQTDDLRDSPAMLLIQQLLEAGAEVVAHDPVAIDAARPLLGRGVTFASTSYEALADADALAVMTDWNEYRNPDFRRMHEALARPVVVDARNLYDPARMAALGFQYDSIGRPHGQVGAVPGAQHTGRPFAFLADAAPTHS
jgi:hypothetical protein